MNFPTPPTTNALAITAAAKSVQGSSCDANEDCFRLDERRGIFVIADGIGGQYGGKRASRLAADGLMHEAQLLLAQGRFEESLADGMGQAFLNVNASILNVAEHLPRFRGMGASALLALVDRGRLHIAGVGDCRAYLVRDDQAERLTIDQTLFQLMVDAGLVKDECQTARSRHLLWTCLGNSDLERPDVRCEEMLRSDCLILATNGVTRVVKDGLMSRIGATSENATATAANVVNAAVTLRTGDDATCVAVSFDGASAEMWERSSC